MRMERKAIQAERIRSALTNTEFHTSGDRAVLLLLLAGRGTFLSEEVEREIVAPCLIWAPSGWTTQVALAAGARGCILRLPERTIGRALPTDALSTHVREIVSRRIFLSDLEQALSASVTAMFDKIELELREDRAGAETVLNHCVALLLLDVWRAAGPVRQSREQQPHRISDTFVTLVELHLQNHWTIEEYASRIGVTRDRLNTAVKRAMGIAPHQHIQRRLMEEAKALLVTTNMQVSEVAYRLGFHDAAYFGRFFRRHEKLPPAQFRRTYTPVYRTMGKDVSFADWP